MNAKDKIYTGKVSEWGLPDGTVMTCVCTSPNWNDWVIKNQRIKFHETDDGLAHCDNNYKIKSLPDGYEFNEAGEIVKVEAKRYWDGKEPLEVGMWFREEGEDCECKARYIYNEQVAFTDANGNLNVCDFSECKQIKQYTDREKTCKDLWNEDIIVMESEYDAQLKVDELIDAVIAGKIHGLKWVGNDET